MKIDLKSLLAGSFLTAFILFSIGGATGGDNKRTWEYSVVTARGFEDDLGKLINRRVAEGWEFVSASGPNNENWAIAVLKREKK